MGLMKRFLNQTRKPAGFLGRLMINSMNTGHAKLSEWGMAHLTPLQPLRIVELGCGGGQNAAELLGRYPEAAVTAIDYSPLSVERTAVRNRAMIASGRCAVQEADVSALTLEPEQYDLATAFETIYFWPGLETCFREVHRVLKPDGWFLIVNESDGRDGNSIRFEKVIDGMKLYTPETISDALRCAGFSTVQVHRHPTRAWIAVLAGKAGDGSHEISY